MRRRRPMLAPLVACVVILGLVGCSDAQEVPATPDGWQRVEVGALSFAVPTEWAQEDTSDEYWSVQWATDTALLIGAPAFGENGAKHGLVTFQSGAQIGGWGYRSTRSSTPVDTATLTVERNDFEYDDVDGVFWAASDPRSDVTVALQLTGRDLPATLVTGIEESLAVVDG